VIKILFKLVVPISGEKYSLLFIKFLMFMAIGLGGRCSGPDGTDDTVNISNSSLPGVIKSMDTQMVKPLGVAGKAVIKNNGKILLLQRALDCDFEPGLWELPGGKISYGENLREGLKREVVEETGLLIKVGLPFDTWNFIKEPFWVTGVTFICEIIRGAVTISDEHCAFQWIDPADYGHFPLSQSVEQQLTAYLKLCNINM
jgi:8-oxo-dGTP diphosphatase